LAAAGLAEFRIWDWTSNGCGGHAGVCEVQNICLWFTAELKTVSQAWNRSNKNVKNVVMKTSRVCGVLSAGGARIAGGVFFQMVAAKACVICSALSFRRSRKTILYGFKRAKNCV
jgi:hypothetical protein